MWGQSSKQNQGAVRECEDLREQGRSQNEGLWILWVLEKLKDTEYGTNKSVIQPGYDTETHAA